MTLPSLIANHRKQVTLTKVKHTYNILNNTLERAKADYGTDVNSWEIPTEGDNRSKSMFFVEKYMLPYLKVVHYCKDKKSEFCGIHYTYLDGSTGDYLGPGVSNVYGTAFILNNGVFVYVIVARVNEGEAETVSRIRIFFDIDGVKGFNKLGYDIFAIELGGAEGPSKGNNANRNKFLPYLYDVTKSCDYYVSDVNHACNPSVTYSGSMCLAYIMCNGWDFGDKYPW